MRRSCVGFQDRWATSCPYPPFGGWLPSRTVSSAFQADSVTRPDPTSLVKKLEARRRIELRVNRFAGGAVTVSLRAFGTRGGHRTPMPKRWFLRPVCLPIPPLGQKTLNCWD